MTLKHRLVSAVPDDPAADAAGEVLPQRDWNDDHILDTADKQVLFTDGDTIGGDAGLTYDKTSNTLSLNRGFVQQLGTAYEDGIIITGSSGPTSQRVGMYYNSFIAFSDNTLTTLGSYDFNALAFQFWTGANFDFQTLYMNDGDIYLRQLTSNGFVKTGGGDGELSVDTTAYQPVTLTTKGDLLGYSTALGRLGVGSNNDVLTADSSATFGIKWAAPASGGVTSIATTSPITGGTITSTGTLGLDVSVDHAFTQAQSVTKAINATSTDGLSLINSTAATVGAQKYSPRLRWTGNGWKTTSTAASQVVDFVAEVQPVQGATNPSANWVLSSQINAAGYAKALTVSNTGFVSSALSGPNIVTYGFDADSGAGLGLRSSGILCLVVAGAEQIRIQNQLYHSNNGNWCVGGGTGQFGYAAASSFAGTIDVNLGRTAAGIYEVNDGGAGNYRDLRVRNLLVGGPNGSYIQTPALTVANLAAAATAGAGARAFVTDGSTTVILGLGLTVVGGGANKVPVYSDGSNWLVG